MTKHLGWLLALNLLAVVACLSDTGTKASSSTPLTMSTQTWYPSPGFPAGHHPGTVSTVAVTGYCGADSQIVSAWEGRQDTAVENSAADSIYVGIVCANGSILNPGTQITTNNSGGVPPEWGSPHPMSYVGMPQLLKLGSNGQVALVSLVADPTLPPPQNTAWSPSNFAVLLSQDGGQTWGSPHLVAPTDCNHGGNGACDLPVHGMTATAGTWIDPTINNYDLFAVWNTGAGHSYSIRFGYNGTGGWMGPSLLEDLPTMPGSGVALEPTMVAGYDALVGNFLFLVAPEVPSVQSPEATILCSTGSQPVPEQDWNYLASVVQGPCTNVGQCWTAATQAIVAAPWPRCVGGDHVSNSVYANRGRAPVAYDPLTGVIAVAITQFAPNDPSQSTQIAVYGFHSCSGCSVPAPMGIITTSSRDTDRVAPGLAEDQFKPAIGFDATTGDMALYWYDTAESYTPGITGYHNFVTSLHGQVAPFGTNPTPGNLQLFAPNPPYVFGKPEAGFQDLGDYNGVFKQFTNKFACGFVDGLNPGMNGAGQPLGMFTAFAAP